LKEHPQKQEASDEAITRFVIEQNPFYPDLAEHIIVEQYKKVASRNIDARQEWFQENKTSSLKHIEEINDAQYESYQEDHQGEPRKTARQKKSPDEREEESKEEMTKQACKSMQG
jgi:hypothetical protein